MTINTDSLTFMIVKLVLVSQVRILWMLWGVISVGMGVKTLVWIMEREHYWLIFKRLSLALCLEFSYVPFSSVIPSLTCLSSPYLWHLLLFSP